MKILVCNPAFYDVTYSINPWMLPEHGIDSKLAADQWKNLVVLLEHVGATVVHMSGVPNLPDMVFTANAGFFTGRRRNILLSNFKCPERQPEKEIYKNWLEDHGYLTAELPPGLIFEGAGDILIHPESRLCSDPGWSPGLNKMYLGYGFRTDEKIYDYISFEFNVRKMKLINSYFYHLDTCFCPLPGNFALIYRGAFEEDTINGLILDGPELLFVPEEEAKKFACNAVSVDNCVIIPSGCPKTKQMLVGAGYEVFDTDMSEYIKAGGACKCLTLKLDLFQ